MDVETLVVGAGIAGLGAALELERAGGEVLVVDAFAHPGGVMATDEIRGFRVERGPNTFQLKPPLHAFLRDHGLESSLCAASPESRKRFILQRGQLVPVPMDPLRFARSRLLSAGGKLRLLAEPFVAGGDATGESVADFVTRRLGPQATSALVGPFLTGVYAGDERKLGVEAVFASLVALEREHGGIARGAVARGVQGLRARLTRRAVDDPAPAGLPGTWSAPEGLGQFARTLASRLRQPVRLGTRVIELARDGSVWRAQLQSGAEHSEVRARGVRSDGAEWWIAVESPVAGTRLIQSVVRLRDSAIATSGDYRNFFEHDGRRYSHTVDPRTGWPIEHNLGAASVISTTAIHADAWATALLVLGPDRGVEIARREGLAANLIVRTDQDIEQVRTAAFETNLVR
jgi:phytoene dehydrogenase-like protein